MSREGEVVIPRGMLWPAHCEQLGDREWIVPAMAGIPDRRARSRYVVSHGYEDNLGGRLVSIRIENEVIVLGRRERDALIALLIASRARNHDDRRGGQGTVRERMIRSVVR